MKTVEEFFEVFTGGNHHVSTWTPKAIMEFAEDYHRQTNTIPAEEVEKMIELLKFANCPRVNCDNEGSLTIDDHGDATQVLCDWCYLRKLFLRAYVIKKK